MTKIKSIHPAPGYILLAPLEDEDSKDFVIADKDQTPQKGMVVSVGAPIYLQGTSILQSAPCGPDDEVIHSAFGFEKIKLDGNPYRLVPFDKIIAIMRYD